MVRKQGLTIDSLLSAEVVTAEGHIVRASETENPDLFWAIRGGGGNFGIVTEFEFQVHEVGTVLAGLIGLPATPYVLRRYADLAKEAPEELSTICFLMPAPPAPFVPADAVGQLTFMVMLCYTGDLAEGEKAVAPLRQIADPMFELVAPMPYPAIYDFTQDGSLRARDFNHSQFMDEMPDEAIQAFLDAMALANPLSFIQIRTLGGQMARVSSGETAFAHRDANYLVAIVGMWEDDAARDQAVRWVDDVFAKVRPFGDGTYVNFIQYETDRLGDAYPPATLSRLAQVKRRYDPENVFSQNQNVRPATR
jgi:FAD/FMN-containing dehydrogenase